MKYKYENMLKQALHFFIISGIGWCLDFSIYSILTFGFNFDVSCANMISTIPAVTYVFLMSTRKVFEKSQSKINLKYKYLIYIIYQIFMVFLISIFGDFLYDIFINSNLIQTNFIYKYLKILIKILITPITMLTNFLVMKLLIEKL